MAYTLPEAAKLSNDVLQAGVLEMFVKDDPILERLPFTTIVGNALTYNIELTEPTAKFYHPNETWTEDTGTVEQAIANIKILGGDSDVDNFILATRSNINDIKAEALKAKVKAVRKKFMDTFWYGYDASGIGVGGRTGRDFSGMHALVSSVGTNTARVPAAGQYLSYNSIGMGTGVANSAPLSMTKLEETIDKIKGFKPDLMAMSKLERRSINVYLRGAGGITYEDFANKRVQTVFGLPVGVSDYIRDDEGTAKWYSAWASNDYGFDFSAASDILDATSIFILTFDPKGCCGVQNGSMTTVPLGDLETKDASRYRIKWYVSLMLQNILSCSKISGISNHNIPVA